MISSFDFIASYHHFLIELVANIQIYQGSCFNIFAQNQLSGYFSD